MSAHVVCLCCLRRFGDGSNSTDIHAMISGEGEEIPFFKMLKARKPCVGIDNVGNAEPA